MKRWLLWTLRCRRGRRCARLQIVPDDENRIAPGLVVQLEYTCGACGTDYQLEAFVDDGELIELNRERRA